MFCPFHKIHFYLLFHAAFCEQSFTIQPSAKQAIVGDAEVILQCSVAEIAGDLHWQKDGLDSIAIAYPRNTPINTKTSMYE